MDEQAYEKISRTFRENSNALLWLRLVNRALTLAGYIAYPLLLVLVALAGGLGSVRALCCGASYRLYSAERIPSLLRCSASLRGARDRSAHRKGHDGAFVP